MPERQRERNPKRGAEPETDFSGGFPEDALKRPPSLRGTVKILYVF
jgi:hypothetical protein